MGDSMNASMLRRKVLSNKGSREDSIRISPRTLENDEKKKSNDTSEKNENSCPGKITR